MATKPVHAPKPVYNHLACITAQVLLKVLHVSVFITGTAFQFQTLVGLMFQFISHSWSQQ